MKHIVSVVVALAAVVAAAPSARAAPETGALSPPALDIVLVERFVAHDGRRSFVLDRSGAAPLMRFDGSREVFALRAAPAARGDVVYYLDTHEQILRVLAVGGAVLYPRDRRAGIPARRVGPAERPLPPLQEARMGVRESARYVAGVLGRSLRQRVEVETPADPDVDASAFADAARLAGLGVIRAARSDPGATVSLDRVRIERGAPAAVRDNGVLTVRVDPALGYHGRPSSLVVEAAVRGRP